MARYGTRYYRARRGTYRKRGGARRYVRKSYVSRRGRLTRGRRTQAINPGLDAGIWGGLAGLAYMNMRRRPGTASAQVGADGTVQNNNSGAIFQYATKWGDNATSSRVNIGYGMPKNMYVKFLKRMQGTQCESKMGSAKSTCAQGKQAMYTSGHLSRQDLDLIKQRVNNDVTTNNEVKFAVFYVKRKIVIRNQSNHNQKVTMYDVLCKRTANTNLVDSPVECWERGYTDLGLTQQHLIPNNTPFKSKEFNRFWATKKVTIINLEPGQQHEHTVVHKVNRMIASTIFEGQATSFVGGLSQCTVIVHLGSIGHDTTTTDNINYMPGVIDIVETIETSFGFEEQKKPTYNFTNSLATVTNFDFMGENQDVDIDPINA